ncbi:MAG TPA: hypothetical protein VKY59_18370, partial [Spirillospora sp.]|nr:hypothetical protein [Spirillospora sp.]
MTDQQKFDCCLIGEGSLLIRCGEQLLSRGHQIQHIVTANDAVIDWAHEHHIEVVRPDDDLAAALRQPAFDYLFSIANLNIIPADVLA